MKLVLYTTLFWCVATAIISSLCVVYGIPPYITDLQGNFLLKHTVIAGLLTWCAFAIGIGSEMEKEQCK